MNASARGDSNPDLVIAKRTAWTLIVGGMAAILDTTIVSVALHTLAADLSTSVDVIQWVSTAYLLALGVTVPTVAWAQRRFGGKRLWMFSLLLFLLESVLCSLAWNASSLIGFRVVQGIGAGIMLPLMSTLVVQAAGGKNLGSLMALVSMPIALGPILGPVLGGIILNSLSWHWLFLVNVPFCLVGLVLAWRYLPVDTPGSTASLDVVGLGLLSPAILGLLYGLGNSSKPGGFGRTDTLLPVLAGMVLLLAFVAWSRSRRERALIDIRLFRHWPLSSSFILLFCTGIAIYGAMLLLPLYFQEIRATDALGAGLLLIPQGVGTFLSRTISGRLADRVGTRIVVVTGFVIIGIGTLPFVMVTATTPIWILMVVLFIRGFGLGAVTIPLMAVAFDGLDRSDVPEASILTRLASQLGGSFGTALFASILTGAMAAGVSGVDAFQHAFWWATGLTTIAAVLALALPGASATQSVAPVPVPAES